MLRDIKILLAGGHPAKLFDMVIELVQSVDDHKKYIERMELQHTRHVRDLIEQFGLVLETDEPEALRDGLMAGLSDLNDHVARLEEHSST